MFYYGLNYSKTALKYILDEARRMEKQRIDIDIYKPLLYRLGLVQQVVFADTAPVTHHCAIEFMHFIWNRGVCRVLHIYMRYNLPVLTHFKFRSNVKYGFVLYKCIFEDGGSKSPQVCYCSSKGKIMRRYIAVYGEGSTVRKLCLLMRSRDSHSMTLLMCHQ